MSEAVGLINYDDDGDEVFIGRDLAHAQRPYGENVMEKDSVACLMERGNPLLFIGNDSALLL